MSGKNLTDVDEFFQVIGLGALHPKLSEAISELANRVNSTGNKGSIDIKIDFSAHKREDYFNAKTTLVTISPKNNGSNKDTLIFKDIFKVDEQGRVSVLTPSEASDLN